MTEIFNKTQHKIIRKKLRGEMTKSETVLWKNIKGSQLGFKFRRQCGIGKYVVDFYCPEIKLVVEVDGLSHTEEQVFVSDQLKEKYFSDLGLHVRRYSSERVFKFLKEVLEDLYNTCNDLKYKTLTTPYAPPSKGGDRMGNYF